MKNIFKFLPLSALLLAMASCTESHILPYEVEKPSSIADQEVINAYSDLKTYVNRQSNPNFKLGAGITLADYINKSVMYRLANKNFDEITLGYEMKHGAIVQADGKLNLDKVNELFEAAAAANISVYGHTLCWHSNQNATYLKKLIAPIVTASTGPGWDLVTAADFETDNTSNYEVNSGASMAFTAVGGGMNGVGRALKVTNPTVRANDWQSQFFIKFAPGVQQGQRYTLKMDIKSDVDATYPTQAHVTPGAYKHWDFFGQLPSTTTWATYTKEITVSSDQATCGAIAFNLGAKATSYYFDNITLTRYNATGSVTTVERTPEQKKAIITQALDTWISGMVKASAPYVKAWDVVNEPMDDASPYQLKTGVGRVNLPADEFYWQDYMGKDYAVEAFRLTRLHGNAGDKLFVNDYNLEYNLDKCRGIIEYVKYIETKGQVVDGIGTQMHLSLSSDRSKIETMFQLLAATGKLIKVSELDIAAGQNATAFDLQLQAELYKFVVDKYMQYIPAAQRYGITVWGVKDSASNASWLPGQNQGIFNQAFTRKPSYASFAEGLKAGM